MSYSTKAANLVSVVEQAGVELRISGTRYVGHCPFHNEKTPSFFVFDDQHFHCFGCGAHGNAINFVRKLHGLSFPEALKQLGIEQGRLTPEMKADIGRRKIERQKAEDKKQFKINLQNTLSILISATKKAVKNFKTINDLEKYGDILQPLPWWEHCLDLISFGTKEEQDFVCEQFRNEPLIPVRRFFKPEFNLNKVIDKIFEKRDADEWEISLHFAGRETSCAEAPASG